MTDGQITASQPNGRRVPANDSSLDTMVTLFIRELADLIDGDTASPKRQVVAGQLRKLAKVLEGDQVQNG
jgi:hypothetical protein